MCYLCIPCPGVEDFLVYMCLLTCTFLRLHDACPLHCAGLVPELVHSYTNHASVDEFIELHCILMILISEIASGSDAGKRALIDGDAPSVVLGVLRGLENDLHSHVDTVKWACMAAAFLLDGDVEAQRIFLANGIIPVSTMLMLTS